MELVNESSFVETCLPLLNVIIFILKVSLFFSQYISSFVISWLLRDKYLFFEADGGTGTCLGSFYLSQAFKSWLFSRSWWIPRRFGIQALTRSAFNLSKIALSCAFRPYPRSTIIDTYQSGLKRQINIDYTVCDCTLLLKSVATGQDL